jgi:hypothetical protein
VIQQAVVCNFLIESTAHAVCSSSNSESDPLKAMLTSVRTIQKMPEVGNRRSFSGILEYHSPVCARPDDPDRNDFSLAERGMSRQALCSTVTSGLPRVQSQPKSSQTGKSESERHCSHHSFVIAGSKGNSAAQSFGPQQVRHAHYLHRIRPMDTPY